MHNRPLTARAGGVQVVAVVADVRADAEVSALGSGLGLEVVHVDTCFVRQLQRKALAKAAQFPGLAQPEAISRARTLWEFDDAFTSVVHGFRDAADYYSKCSSIDVLEKIRVPTLLLSARDDPFHPSELLDDVARRAARNPVLTLEFLESGGHVGFVSGSPFRPRYYGEWRAAEFIAEKCRGRKDSIDQQRSAPAR